MTVLSPIEPESSLAYFRERADEQFWSEQWASVSLEHVVALAETSAVTAFLERYIRSGLRVIEGGCGLGQYVVYFASRGVDIVGVDYSDSALAAHRATYPASRLQRADLTALPFDDASFDVYVSLGVIEHYEDFGAAILSEARRVLAPGGRLIVSTPYLNRSRRLLRRAIEARQRVIAESGGGFYQYAFDAPTLDRILTRNGFVPRDRSFYDPGRGIRDVRSLLKPQLRPATGPVSPADAPKERRRLVRTLLYSRPVLATFAHMQIVSAEPIRLG